MATRTRSNDHHAADEQSAAPRFVQCRVPADLYEWMRLQGFLTRRSMNSIALEAVAAYRIEVEAGRVALERVTLIQGETMKYNVRLGDDLYEWLRTAAFHAHLSINALVVAALARSHAAHAGADTVEATGADA